MILLRLGENKQGRYLMEGNDHHVFFLCNQMKQCPNCKMGPCTHTLYLEDAKNGLDYLSMVLGSDSFDEFEKYFEKIYFTDDGYDWWEKEDSK